MRLLVCGDRDWIDKALIWKHLFDLYYDPKSLPLPFVVIEGCARGADKMAGDWADQGGDLHGIEHLKFPANWALYGKAAGPIRNQKMLVEGAPTYCLAFHNDLEHSKGTKDIVERCKKAGVPVKVVTH